MRWLLGLLLTCLASSAFAQLQCPQVRLIVPYPAGGATDVAARLVGQGLEPALKKSVIIENRAGATGNIGTIAVVGAPPDGCTLLINAAVIATFPASFSKLGYDPIKDLTPDRRHRRDADAADHRERQPAERPQGRWSHGPRASLMG